MFGTDDVEVMWIAGATLEIDSDGNGEIELAGGLSLNRETALWIHSLIVDGDTFVQPVVAMSILNPTEEMTSEADIQPVYRRIAAAQEERYSQPLGEPDADGAVEHRVVLVIEGVLLTQSQRVPSGEMRPWSARPSAGEQAQTLDDIRQSLGWAMPIPEDWWTQQVQAKSPYAYLLCPRVYGQTHEAAAGLVHDLGRELIAVLALTRQASARPIATIVERVEPDGRVEGRLLYHGGGYSGNLLGGFISGESQSEILQLTQGIRSDPLLRLCADLYREALAEPSADARFLRLWSILELLSGARVGEGQPVLLSTGSEWPGQHGTTSYAAPRVYQLLSEHFRARNIDAGAAVQPAVDLYQAVRAWYGRRNATGHYGRFLATDPVQSAQSWHRWAVLTSSSQAEWLSALRRAVEMILRAELLNAGVTLDLES
ncbi:hypothetical protein ACFP8W_00420 [Nocardioides hankookensis]